jgi:CubicO group peptidase (beta-lactamase class C family)
VKKIFTLISIVLGMASSTVIAKPPSPFIELSGFIQRTKLETVHPSGTALAIVKDGEVIYQGYFGFSDINQKTPVTRDTVFYIASATKPFFALNTLVKAENGEIDTRTSLQEMFPDVRFNDLDAKSITAKDLLVHSSGVDNQPMVWATALSGIHDAKSRRALVAASYLDEDAKPGTFKYSNVGYNIMSVWLEEKMSTPWQAQLDKAIFKPLNMGRTSAYISKANAEKWPMAKPYSFANAEPNAPLYLSKSDNTMQAAGGIVSTAPDLAKFLIAQLEDGMYRRKQVFPKSVITQSHASQINMDGRYLDFKRTGYAWGWYTGEYKGKSMLHHFGSFAGFHAHLSFIPEENIGLVVLNNEDVLSTRLTNLIADHAYGILLKEPNISSKMSGRFDELLKQAKELQQTTAKQRNMIQVRAWQLSRPIDNYSGIYSNELLGKIIVSLNKDGKMVISWGKLSAIATGYDRADHVRVEFSPNSGDLISFLLKDGNVDAISFADATFKKAR